MTTPLSPRHVISLRLDPELARRVKIFASLTDTSANEIISLAVGDYLTAHGPELRAAAAERAAILTAVATDKLASL
jgi:predicted transcriptional regulator